MNGALRSGGGSPETHKLIGGCDEGPSIGCRPPRTEISGDGVAQGRSMLDEAFSLTRISPRRDSSVAAQFAEMSAKKSPLDNILVEFRIKNRTAPDIQSFSAYANEAEHLTPGAA